MTQETNNANNSLETLFVEGTSETKRRTLTGTQELTAIASEAASSLVSLIEANFDEYVDKVVEAQEDHLAMDRLLEQLVDFDDLVAKAAFLQDLDEATINGMLKSQQSKRSRAKSGEQTSDNFNKMIIGAICENIIRKVTGRAKTYINRRMNGGLDYTEDELQWYADNQLELRREIRNIQSKKSIFKKKAADAFDENDEQWQKLLEAEQSLKGIRTSVPSGTNATKRKLEELLGDTDIKDLKAAEAKDILAALQES